MQDYQSLNRQLEAVEGSIPTVGLVEETEERLMDRISLYQVQKKDIKKASTHAHYLSNLLMDSTPATISRFSDFVVLFHSV